MCSLATSLWAVAPQLVGNTHKFSSPRKIGLSLRLESMSKLSLSNVLKYYRDVCKSWDLSTDSLQRIFAAHV